MSTLSKMSAFDSIRVKVHEDGDVELTKVNEANILSDALYFGISEIADGGLWTLNLSPMVVNLTGLKKP